jgi:hypothetical protein
MTCSLLVVFASMTHVLVSATARSQSDSKNRADGFDHIPDPKMEEIRVRTRKNWPNPFVVVNSDNFDLILYVDGRRIDKELSLSDLEKALMSLGLERWPLGRVVAVAENGLRSPDDNKKISEKCEQVKKMLEMHKVMIELWPSG